MLGKIQKETAKEECNRRMLGMFNNIQTKITNQYEKAFHDRPSGGYRLPFLAGEVDHAYTLVDELLRMAMVPSTIQYVFA